MTRDCEDVFNDTRGILEPGVALGVAGVSVCLAREKSAQRAIEDQTRAAILAFT